MAIPDASRSRSPVPGVHPPRQKRSRVTFERIVAAARELSAERGVDAVTVKDVLHRADVGAGSFYARFDGREALIRYLHADLWADGGRRWRAYLAPDRWAGLGLPAVVGEVVRVLVRSHFRTELELRGFWIGALSRPAGPAMERAAEWDDAFVEGFGRLLEHHRDEIGHPRPERAARLAAFQLLVTLRGHVLFPDSFSPGGGGFSVRDLILELTRAALAYLEAGPPPDTYAQLLAASPRRLPAS